MGLYDLLSDYTSDQAFADIVTTMKHYGYDSASLSPGSALYALMKTQALMIASLHDKAKQIYKATDLQYAEGDTLDIIAEQHYGITRDKARQAIGYVTITNDDTVDVDIDYGSMVIKSTVDDSITFSPIDASTYTYTPGMYDATPVICSVPGRVGNVDIDTLYISALSTTPSSTKIVASSGVYPGYTWLYQPGTDDETDISLRARCVDKVKVTYDKGYDIVYKLQQAGYTGITKASVSHDGTKYIYTLATSEGAFVAPTIISAATAYVTTAPTQVKSCINRNLYVTGVIKVVSSSAASQQAIVSGMTAWIKALPLGGTIKSQDFLRGMISWDIGNVIALSSGVYIDGNPIGSLWDITIDPDECYVPQINLTFEVV